MFYNTIFFFFIIIISIFLCRHFKKYSSLFLEFLPQLLFLVVLFLYLVVLMFVKWVLYSPTSPGTYHYFRIVIAQFFHQMKFNDTSPRFVDMAYTPGCAPSILITFINMILMGHAQVREGCSEYMFPGQTTLQLACVIIAALCVPVMLFGKPLFFLLHKKNAQAGKVMVNNS